MSQWFTWLRRLFGKINIDANGARMVYREDAELGRRILIH